MKQDQIKGKSLYERLGGVEGISSIVDDIVENHMKNPAVKARFLPLKENPGHFSEVRLNLINFFAAGSGGPQEYHGKDMLSAHQGMNVSQGEYMHVIDDIMKALEKNKIDEQTRNDVLAIAYSLKTDIVGV